MMSKIYKRRLWVICIFDDEKLIRRELRPLICKAVLVKTDLIVYCVYILVIIN